MTVAYVADATAAGFVVARTVAAIVFPALGLTLLILGIRRRSAARNHPPGYPIPGPPGYPIPGPPGYGSYPPPGGVPPAQPQPQPQPQPPKSAGSGLIATGIILLVIGAVGIAGSMLAVGNKLSRRMAIGDCFTNTILNGGSDWHPSHCSDPDAVLQYAANADAIGHCPDGRRTDSAYLSLKRDGVRLCFAPNLLPGHCYIAERDDRTVEQVDCTTAGAIRVVQRIDGSTSKADCPDGTRAATYKEPKRTYCTERTERRYN